MDQLRTLWYGLSICLLFAIVQSGAMSEPCETGSLSAESGLTSLLDGSDFDEYRPLVVNGEELCFSGRVFRRLTGPIVYAFLQTNEVLYVGMSRNGIGRPAYPQHEAALARKKSDDVRIWTCRSLAEAKRLESFLIRKWKPAYNRFGKVKPEPFSRPDFDEELL